MIPVVIHFHLDHFPFCSNAAAFHFLQFLHQFVSQLRHLCAVLAPGQIMFVAFHGGVDIHIAVSAGEKCHQAAAERGKGITQRAGITGRDLQSAEMLCAVRMSLPVDHKNGLFKTFTLKLDQHHLIIRLTGISHRRILRAASAEVCAGKAAVRAADMAHKGHTGEVLFCRQHFGRRSVCQRQLCSLYASSLPILTELRLNAIRRGAVAVGRRHKDLFIGNSGSFCNFLPNGCSHTPIARQNIIGEQQDRLVAFRQRDASGIDRFFHPFMATGIVIGITAQAYLIIRGHIYFGKACL